ncbi:MAG: homocysteine S-methyltransferase family protein [Gammaproteobacteria bacterium]|jgi:S-methylmethionine-dependent homocysteine/selenocysteine methylase
MNRAHRPGGQGLRILDGGTGSELRRRGVSLSKLCWSAAANLHHLEVLREIHADYIGAGADVITANTFATSRFVLASAGLDTRFETINRRAIGAAREAASLSGSSVSVAASLSCLPPAFETSRYPDAESEHRAYAELADCFAECGADLILLEMMQDPAHAARACRAARASGLPFWVGVSCRLLPQNDGLVAFDNPEQPIAEVIDMVAGFDPAGIAIMHSPAEATGFALTELAERWQGPIGAWAELPYPEDTESSFGEPLTPSAYAALGREWLEAGASLIGGCCGTTPEHIRALAELRQD